MSNYENLFEPITIGSVEIKNRIVFAALDIVGLVGSKGEFTQRALDYYIERAKGGVGLITTGVAKVENKIEHKIESERILITPHIVASLGELVEHIHYYGAKLFVQLTAGDGRNNPDLNIVAPSTIPSFWIQGVSARALSNKEIEEIIDAFRNAVKILKDTGVDGIELNGHEGYLLDEFKTALWNKRNDQYGGNLKNRINFTKKIITAIRSETGENFPIIYKYGMKHFIRDLKVPALKQEKFIEVGRDIEEGIELAKLLEEMGINALEVDAGCYDSWYWVHPPIYQPHGCLVEFSEKAKKEVNIPIIAVGRLGIPDLAEQVLQQKKADMIALGRPLLADPYWPKKVKKGDIKNIRPCIGCHDGCLTRIERGKPISCSVNPTVGVEKVYTLEKMSKHKKILVAGGGIAGMEAARVASLRGYNVFLYEKKNELGGHLVSASVPDFKEDIKRLLNWYKNQMNKLSVKINLDSEVSVKLTKEIQLDAIIVATGSIPIIPDISGIDNPKIMTASETLINFEKIGKEIIIIGGGMLGLETALWLSKKRKRVTVIEMSPDLGIDGALSNRTMLLDLVLFYHVKLMTKTVVSRIYKDYIKIHNKEENKIEEIGYDNLILACGFSKNNLLKKQLESELKGLDIFSIGDCYFEQGNIMKAIWSAYHTAREI